MSSLWYNVAGFCLSEVMAVWSMGSDLHQYACIKNIVYMYCIVAATRLCYLYKADMP